MMRAIDEGTGVMAANLKVVAGGDKVSTDREKALEAALAQIDRAFGKGSAMKLGSRELVEIETISTGSLGLDIALGVGGLPRGRVIEVYGPESSGKTTLALHVIAEAQKNGGTAAFVDVDAKFSGIDRVERVFGIDEGADAALLLRLGDGVQSQRGLAGGFRPVDFNDAPPRQAADAKRDIEAERARGDDVDIHRPVVLAELHDRALAEVPLDLGQRRVERLGLVHGSPFDDTVIRLAHGYISF